MKASTWVYGMLEFYGESGPVFLFGGVKIPLEGDTAQVTEEITPARTKPSETMAWNYQSTQARYRTRTIPGVQSIVKVILHGLEREELRLWTKN
jgi:hypothetical protein